MVVLALLVMHLITWNSSFMRIRVVSVAQDTRGFLFLFPLLLYEPAQYDQVNILASVLSIPPLELRVVMLA